LEQFILARFVHRSETHERRVIAAIADDLRFADRIPSSPADTGNPHHGLDSPAVGTVHLLGDQFNDRAKQRVLRGADRKLCRMNADRQTTCAGVEVVADERSLTLLIELPALI
jgi:hypothetical protein